MWSAINTAISNLNNNKYFFGMVMLLLNTGSRYIEIDFFSKNQRRIFNTTLLRRLLIFTICFTATRDIIVSLIITGCFIIFVMNLFNEESDYCVLPEYLKKFDLNNDGVLSEEELQKAAEVLKKEGQDEALLDIEQTKPVKATATGSPS